jgi:hypothetical protein
LREGHGRKRRVSKNKSCTSGEATGKREIPAQQKRGEIQVKIIALAEASGWWRKRDEIWRQREAELEREKWRKRDEKAAETWRRVNEEKAARGER